MELGYHTRVMKDGVDHLAEEAELVRQATGGDGQACRCLFEYYVDLVHGFVKKILGDHHDAEDVSQEAFTKAFQSLKSFKGECLFSTWLMRIAYTCAMNCLKKRKRDRRMISLDRVVYEAEMPTEPSDDADGLWATVARLPEDQRVVITLRYGCGRHGCVRPYAEIAEIISKPLGTVSNLMGKAYGNLRRWLGDR